MYIACFLTLGVLHGRASTGAPRYPVTDYETDTSRCELLLLCLIGTRDCFTAIPGKILSVCCRVILESAENFLFVDYSDVLKQVGRPCCLKGGSRRGSDDQCKSPVRKGRAVALD